MQTVLTSAPPCCSPCDRISSCSWSPKDVIYSFDTILRLKPQELLKYIRQIPIAHAPQKQKIIIFISEFESVKWQQVKNVNICNFWVFFHLLPWMIMSNTTWCRSPVFKAQLHSVFRTLQNKFQFEIQLLSPKWAWLHFFNLRGAAGVEVMETDDDEIQRDLLYFKSF